MARKKRYIKGKIYVINDRLVSRDRFSKPNRRVVAINNDKNNVHIVKIKSLFKKNGERRKNLIPIENYNCLNKLSGIHPKVYRKTAHNKPILERRMRKTKARLNKWDMRKISHLR